MNDCTRSSILRDYNWNGLENKKVIIEPAPYIELIGLFNFYLRYSKCRDIKRKRKNTIILRNAETTSIFL